MATNILHQTTASCTGEHISPAPPAQRNGIPFTPEQSEILGQAYRQILSWGKSDIRTDTALAIRKES